MLILSIILQASLRLRPKCIIKLQVVKSVLEFVARSDVKTFANEGSELVGVLARGGHPPCFWPVVVQLTQLVSQLLDVLRLEATIILDHTVGGVVDGSLLHRLTHEEEVVRVWQSHNIVYHCPG